MLFNLFYLCKFPYICKDTELHGLVNILDVNSLVKMMRFSCVLNAIRTVK